MSFAVSILEQGLIYGILALGIYITYKILDFPDLTVDGSFPLGAAVTALMITKGANPYLTLQAAFAAGVAAGICTGLIHVRYHYDDSALDDQPSCGRNSQCTIVFPEDNL